MAVVGGIQDLRRTAPPPRPGSGQAIGATTTAPAAPAPAPAQQGYVPEAAAPPAYGVPMRALTQLVRVDTERHLEFVDVTDHVAGAVGASGVRDGFAVVFSRHTTAGIRINEHEPLLLEDMARLLEHLAPTGAGYGHDDFAVRTVNLTEDERVNGHSHCRSLLLGASETVPISAGRLLLGRWQRIFLVELDGPAERELIIQIVGG